MKYLPFIWFCWGAFCLMWLGGAVYNIINGPTVVRKGMRSWWSWLIGLLIIWFLTASHQRWLILRMHLPWLQIPGIIILIAGTIFTLWSRLVLGAMWSSAVTLKQDHRLRTDGPYRITRHPIYTGMLGMLVGSALLNFLFLPALLLSLIIFLTKIPNEERLMTGQFGQQYLEYQGRVPQLIPGVHPNRSNKS